MRSSLKIMNKTRLKVINNKMNLENIFKKVDTGLNDNSIIIKTKVEISNLPLKMTQLNTDLFRYQTKFFFFTLLLL